MRLFSHEFPDSGFMPTQTSFVMGNVKPVLYVDAIPKSCRSLSITCIDHDAAKVGGFVHWLAWNIDTSQSEIITDAAHGAVEGNNDWGTIG